MKGVLLLMVILGAILAMMGIVVEASPNDSDKLAVLAGMVVIALGVALVGPLGRAIANLVGAGDAPKVAERQALLMTQLDEVIEDLRLTREELAELQERLDFTERLLARQQQPALPDRAAENAP